MALTDALPIDEVLPALLSSLDQGARRIILEAPPGAGKTTRLPPALIEQAWCKGRVLVSEPRRIAARLAASRVASERGERLGDQVGYQVRFDDKTSRQTRLIFLTEGLLLRRLLDEPLLPGIDTVVLDEVHERSADLDVILALLKESQIERPDLRVICMSATLDADRLASYLGPDCVRHRSEGRSFPVSVIHQNKEDEHPLNIQVRSAVKEAQKTPGDILVFLPGAAEIRACEEALSQLPDFQVQSLHGDMPVEEQAKVVGQQKKHAPEAQKRRVVLSTNIAESSLTIVGVTTVIDSGLARGAVFDPWSGVSRLETIEISQARIIQRSGRAGRVCEGQALRLFTAGGFARRPVQDTPELQRCDLSSVYLQLLARESRENKAPSHYSFLDPPSAAAWQQAEKLVRGLGAMESEQLTLLGSLMARLALSPRLSRCAIEGAVHGQTARTCLAVALLSERDVLLSYRGKEGDVHFGDSDLDERIERFLQLQESGFAPRVARDLSLDLRTARQVAQLASSIYSQLHKTLIALSSPQLTELKIDIELLEKGWQQQLNNEDHSYELARILLAGFADRVAMKRAKGRELILENGVQASLAETSCVLHAPLLLALSCDAPGGRLRKPLVRLAARMDADWLMEFDAERIEASEEFLFNPEKERVDVLSRLNWGKVILDETRSEAPVGPKCAEVLSHAATLKGPAVYDPDARLESLQTRLAILLKQMPERFSDLESELRERLALWSKDEEALRAAALLNVASECSNLAQLKGKDLSETLIYALPPEIQQALLRETPLQTRLHGGLNVEVHYQKERPPWIEARLQNFFSMSETPQICGGRLNLQLHLLAPNHRAVQVTSDLKGFWERHYPDLRKQLMRRYPKHLWPEDGRTATPPAPGRIR